MGAAIVGVDFEKAYDLVNREVLWKILDIMGYPSTFVRWLQTMYSVAGMSILNGTEVAGVITDIQSIRQGCPLSVHLFVLYIEPLLVRLSQVLKGISLFNEKLSVRAFVDDVTIFISCDEDFTRAGQVIDLFCQWTKARMNKEKTKALGLGIWRTRMIWPLQWLASTPTLSLLGIKFSSSIEETADRVWGDAVGLVNGILRENADRRFTLYQRVIFIKSKALARTVFLAQVLPCKEKLADQILKAVMKYLWIGKVERPQKTVIYRAVNQGGLGMVNTHLFYRSLFLCPIYKVLTGPKSFERSLLRYWMAFPLRSLLPLYKGNTVPVAVMKRPAYLQEPLRQIQQLFASSILSQGNPMVHRKTYNHWILEVTTKGKLEMLRPNLDWPRIWKETAALPSNIREIMFLFNQRLLPTRTRCHRLDPSKDATCPICNQQAETDEHLMFQCPERLNVWSWLEGTVRHLGCRAPKEDFIRGHFGPICNLRIIFTLLAAYVFTTWKARNHQRIPEQAEVETLWKGLCAPRK
jgi:hypothetical protein